MLLLLLEEQQNNVEQEEKDNLFVHTLIKISWAEDREAVFSVEGAIQTKDKQRWKFCVKKYLYVCGWERKRVELSESVSYRRVC